MNYEERYNQALERARIEYKNEQSKGNIWVCENLSTIFPELRESEDEKIRKDLITYINSIKGDTLDLTMRAPKWLCWLEKQKEKKQIIAVDSDQLLKILPRTVEWSEEYEEMIDFMIEFIESLCWRKDLTQRKDNVLSWLKSIKPNHWKPSKEQLSSLGRFIEGVYGCVDFTNIKSLYNELKQL